MAEQDGPDPTVPQPEPQLPPAPAPAAGPLVPWDVPGAPPPSQPSQPPVPPPAGAPTPLVAWAPPPAAPAGGPTLDRYDGEAPAFTVGAILTDTFARYGADLLRLFVVSVAASGISWLSSLVSTPAAGSSPFTRSPGFVDVGGILGLASFVIGLVASATIFALAEGGRGLPLARAVRRGAERAGWVFLTTLLLGAAFIAMFLLALIPIALFAVISPRLVILPIVIVFALFIWAALRLSLALPGVVVDNRNSVEAVKLSWRVTRPVRVWVSLLAAAFLLGLLFVPAAAGAMLVVFPAMLSARFGVATGTVAPILLFLVPAIVFSIFTPLATLLSFSAYRRLVPPLQPSWTLRPDAPVAVPAEPVEPQPRQASSFRVPRLGTAGKALLALAIVADIAGLLAIPYGIGEMERFFREFRGFPGFAPGTTFPESGNFAVPGTVTFSSDVDLQSCTAGFPFFMPVSPSTDVEWIATPRTGVTARDEVFLRVTLDGDEIATTLQDPTIHPCIGSEAPVPDLRPGTYTYELLVNGAVTAKGTLFVR